METNLKSTNDIKVDWCNRLLAERVIWQYPGHGPHTSYTLNSNHSDFYINSDYLNCKPALLKQICVALFNKIVSTTNIQPDWILTYPPFGVHIGFCLAELFECKYACIKSLDEPQINFDLRPNETVLLCADDITSGSCLNKVIKAAMAKDVQILEPIAVVANFSCQSTFNDLQIASLIERKINVWKPEDCPLCAAGSRALAARENWVKFSGLASEEITSK